MNPVDAVMDGLAWVVTSVETAWHSSHVIHVTGDALEDELNETAPRLEIDETKSTYLRIYLQNWGIWQNQIVEYPVHLIHLRRPSLRHSIKWTNELNNGRDQIYGSGSRVSPLLEATGGKVWFEIKRWQERHFVFNNSRDLAVFEGMVAVNS